MPAYWKSRAYLTACVAIAWKRNAYIRGVILPSKEIDRIVNGNALLGWEGEGEWMLGFTSWYPEDMALEPEVFLNGVDPERDNFGIKSALQMWLELEQRGLMDAGINVEQARPKFQKELAKYTPDATE
jgi:hypothetical protein